MRDPSTLVIIPTYNEIESLPILIPNLLESTKVEILIVDDQSPDGTADWVRTFQQKTPRIHLLCRNQKQGLGPAYLEGFRWALQREYQRLVQMDADGSHRVEDLANLLSSLKTADFVVGSRYVEGGGVQNWGLHRKIISRGGSQYARWVLGYPLSDWTGGFNAWNSYVLRSLDLGAIKSNGYSFQIELKYRALQAGFRMKEFPIVFVDRRVGQSKMSFHIILEAVWRVWEIRNGSPQ